MGFPTITLSGTATSAGGGNSATGTLTVQVAGNDDGTVSGTWTLAGTYQSFYGFGTDSFSGTLAGTGGASGPWTITLTANGVTSGPVTLSFVGGQAVFDASFTFGVDVPYYGGYGDVFYYHVDFPTTAHLAASAPLSNFVGTPGDDSIPVGPGNDSIDGSGGIDTAVFSDVRSDYTITNQGNGVFTVTHNGSDTDTLVNVERLQFSDAQVAIDIDGHAGEAYRLYQAAFNRVPDIAGLGFQMHALDLGWTVNNIAGDFLNSPEFQATYGSLNDTQFVQLLYVNVLHRPGEDAGVQFHLNELASGQTRADVLAHFSDSPENQANVIGQIQNGMLYSYP